MISGLAIDNNDALSRRDAGLEFLDVSSQLHAERISSSGNEVRQTSSGNEVRQTDTYRITNTSTSMVDAHLLIIVKELPDRVRLTNAGEMTSSGDPYIRVFLRNGVLQSGQSIVQSFVFRRPHGNDAPVNYSLDFLSGQGRP